MAKIYTKFGDQGETALLGGQKVSKDDLRIEAYGTIDELNCPIGLARVSLSTRSDSLIRLNADLETIQNWLFDLGSLLACKPQDRTRYKLPEWNVNRVTWLEERIDGATVVLPELKDFILPAGSESTCVLHLARTIARRAERAMVKMEKDLPENAIPFINRLSDYLFVMARLCNHAHGVADVIWKTAG